MDAYAQACNGITHAIILNFSGLEYMNSSGIGLLVTCSFASTGETTAAGLRLSNIIGRFLNSTR
jgi:anti-anti-sigma regulatory factor